MKKFYFLAAASALIFASCDSNSIDGDDVKYDIATDEVFPAVKTVVFNELCGNKVLESEEYADCKFIELYNNTDEDISLEGWTIRKFAPDATDVMGTYNVAWTAPEGTTIVAKGYLLLYSDQEDAHKGFNAGLSAKKGVKFTLVDADGNFVDRFVRGTNEIPFEENPLAENKNASFSRVPDGIGEWHYAAPTPNDANGASIGDIENE